MPSGKVAKVVFHSVDDTTSAGVTWIDVTQKTVTADKLATDYTALAADGTDIVGTYEAAPAEVVGVTDTLDEHGGTIRSITAISLAGDTVRPEVLMQGYTAHDQHGNPITGIATSGGITPSGTKQITENGTGIDVLNYASVDVNVSASGSSAKKKQVNFIDYDGTILYSYTAAEANALTALPSNPTHTGLISQGWNWTLTQIKNQLVAQPNAPVWIGQMYITQSGATEIDVTMTAPDLHPYLGIAVNGTVTIDWGDNTTPDTVTGTNSRKFTGHEYAAAGNYTISINVVSGGFTFYCDSYYRGVLSETTEFNRSSRYSNDIMAVRLGENAYIGQNAFNYCTSCTSITIPDSVTSIGNYAFYQCKALASVTIPDGVMSIEDSTFRYCYVLTSVAIPDGVTSIGTYAFASCYSLTSIMIPDGVTSISASAFTSCYTLTSITIPDGVTSIGDNAFQYCYTLTSITIPDNVTNIGNNAFANCYSLTSLTIPDGVTSIRITFASCYDLTSITIPDGVTSIANNAFQYCYSLASITIPDSVRSIGSNTFASCYSLASITIPDGVTTIGTGAFNGCYGIREMHFKPTTPPTITSAAFNSAFATGATIYVPTGCLAAYTSATNYPSSSTYTYVEE